MINHLLELFAIVPFSFAGGYIAGRLYRRHARRHDKGSKQ